MSGAPDLQGLTREQALALLGQPSPAPPAGPVSVQPLPAPQGTNDYGAPLAGPDYNAGFLPSREQTLALLQDSDPAMSWQEDVGRSALAGEQTGAGGLATQAHGLQGMVQGLGQAGLDFLHRHGVTDGSVRMPQVGGLPGMPGVANAGDVIQALAGAAATRLGVDPHLAQMATGAFNPTAAMSSLAPTADQVATGLNGGNPTHTPQTTAGDYAKRTLQFSPMVAAPGSAPLRLARVLASGVGSQAAEDFAPDGLKPLAAMVGAALGGGVAEAGNRLGMAPQASLGTALGENVSTQQMAQAQALRQQAAAQGIQLTIPEAVQQVTNNGTGLGRLQHTIENTAHGKTLTAPYFANRPAQVSAATTALADQIAPPTTQPGMIGVRAQAAATTALDRARQTVNSIAQPDYEALSRQPMDVEPQAQLMGNPSYQIALNQLRNDPELGPTIAGLPDNSVAVVNAVKQRLGTMGEQAKGTPLLPGDNQRAGLRFGAKALADQLARDASPQYANANDTVADLSRRYVDPLKAGPLGAISATSDVPAQTGALYPRTPLAGAPDETGTAVTVLGRQAPGVAEDLTRQHLLNALDSSMRDLQGGQNQYAGAKLAVALAGSPEQAATLRAGVSALPGINWATNPETGVATPTSVGETHASNLDDLLEALQATGKRQQPGSMTAFNSEALQNLHIAPSAQALGRLADPLEWGKGIADVLNRANYRRNVSHLAQLIMAAPEDTQATLQAASGAARGGVNPLLPALLAQPSAR